MRVGKGAGGALLPARRRKAGAGSGLPGADPPRLLLANHGPVVTGKDLRAAADNTEEMEDTARLIFTLGDRPIRYLTDDEIAELRS